MNAMQAISEADIRARITRDNPWWDRGTAAIPEAAYERRAYFEPFCSRALNLKVKRASILLGPRRVGKTVIIKQLVEKAISEEIPAENILYASIDAPVYSGIRLEKFISFFREYESSSQYVVIFDEIQYLKDWEIHLKDLVDSYPNIRFIATGSAAAALRLKSRESGAGRFSEFMLPPLTFHEFLVFSGDDEELIEVRDAGYHPKNIDRLNDRFIDYLNYGGFPEAVLNDDIRRNPDQFIRNDIIDKVLLKDLPSLYGINEIPELNKLFSFLAYNAGSEASLERITQGLGVTKPTIKKYIEYLESAFLIMKVSTVDEHCRTLSRERNFKVYLNNPSMRAALFAPVKKEESSRIGHLAESAIFSQWQHSPHFGRLRYARWKNEGEVDIVYLWPNDDKPHWIGEIKWSDRVVRNSDEQTKHLRTFLRRHPSIKSSFFSTRTFKSEVLLEDRPHTIWPSSLYCYVIGRNITNSIHSNIPMLPKADDVEGERAR